MVSSCADAILSMAANDRPPNDPICPNLILGSAIQSFKGVINIDSLFVVEEIAEIGI